jgi:predicted DNA-binding protein
MKISRTDKPVRVSVSFPPEIYHTLEAIAKQNKVSLAWIVRDATEKYIDNRWPLFAEAERMTP